MEQVRDIVGRYMRSPTHALVSCVDETSQIQALDRTEPVLPMRPDRSNDIAAHHANPKPFMWTKSADEILASIARFAQRTIDCQAAPFITRTTRSGQ
jgi:hypothetical protein